MSAAVDSQGETPQLFSGFYTSFSEEVMPKARLEQNSRSEQDEYGKSRDG